MTRDEIKTELERIGSVYGPTGWTHTDVVRGTALVRELVAVNKAISVAKPVRPAAWGARGERGTVICSHCGKRGQDTGTVCDHCGSAVR